MYKWNSAWQQIRKDATDADCYQHHSVDCFIRIYTRSKKPSVFIFHKTFLSNDLYWFLFTNLILTTVELVIGLSSGTSKLFSFESWVALRIPKGSGDYQRHATSTFSIAPPCGNHLRFQVLSVPFNTDCIAF